MMTALPALVLATLATLGGCTTACPTTTPDEVPELPQPDLVPNTSAPLEAAGEPAPVELDDPTAIVDRLASVTLPGPGDALAPPGGAAESGSSPLEDPTPTPTRDGSEASSPGGSSLDRHVPGTAHSQPTARGEAVHAAQTTARAQGQPTPGSAAAWTASLLASLAAVGLYHKLSKDRALDHPARQRILALLEDDPGLTASQLADELDVCYRTARHHLEVLARFDLVAEAEHRGKRLWARPSDADGLAPDVPEPQRRVLDLLADEPGLHLSEIARRLDLAKATVKHHLDRLTEEGRIEEENVGPLRRFELAEQA